MLKDTAKYILTICTVCCTITFLIILFDWCRDIEQTIPEPVLPTCCCHDPGSPPHSEILMGDNKNADAIYVRGLCRYYQDNQDAAFQHFQNVLRFVPDHSKAKDTYKVSINPHACLLNS